VYSSLCANYCYDPLTKKWDNLLIDFFDIFSMFDFDKSAIMKEHNVVSFSYPELRVITLSLDSIMITSFSPLVSRRNFGFSVLDHYVYAVSCTYFK